jgi:hypothetical protein
VKVTYRDLSTDLSDLELAEPEMDIRSEGLYKKLVGESSAKQADDTDEPPCRPASTTIFHWVDFVCKRSETLLAQLQKELVEEGKRGKEVATLPVESVVENPNSYKADSSNGKDKMLDRLTFATITAKGLLGRGKQQWYRLRAYFLTKAESRKDVLTDTGVRLPITHTFELAIF